MAKKQLAPGWIMTTTYGSRADRIDPPKLCPRCKSCGAVEAFRDGNNDCACFACGYQWNEMKRRTEEELNRNAERRRTLRSLDAAYAKRHGGKKKGA